MLIRLNADKMALSSEDTPQRNAALGLVAFTAALYSVTFWVDICNDCARLRESEPDWISKVTALGMPVFRK